MPWLQATYRTLNLVELACLLAWVIILLPAVAYLWTTWPNRREYLFDHLSEDAIDLYYQQFFPSSAPRRLLKRWRRFDKADKKSQFRYDFGRLYGRRHYVLPFLLLALISAIGLLATSLSVQVWLGSDGKAFPPIAISAFLGAYAWVLYDQFGRFRTGDFTAHDVYSAIFRFLIAIPLGISLAALLKDNAGIAVAFLLGAFPTTTLFTISRRLASQKLGLGETQEGGALELEKLQCVGKSNAERYVDEGITTIADLAWADPIDLTIKTNRQFNFVVDSVSQALLWLYFEDRVKKLYPLSLRGAQEVCSLLNDLNSDKPKEKAAAEANLKLAASMMELDEQSFLYTLLSVKDDPYAQFLFKVWA